MKVFKVILFAFSSIFIFSNTPLCGQLLSNSSETIEGNNAQVNFALGGLYIFDHKEHILPAVLPVSGEAGPLFGTNYAVIGKDQNDVVRGGFPFFWNFPYSPGPLGWNSGEAVYESENNLEYDRLFKVRRNEVRLHKEYYEYYGENGEFPTGLPYGDNYVTPEVILEWPAHGDTTIGQAFNLAPFFDNDCCGGEEGIYEPELGDYPAFKFDDNASEFTCDEHIPGDIALYWIESDINHTTDAAPSFLEFYNLVYLFTQKSGNLSNTIFHRLRVLNRSGYDFHDMYLTNFEDFDLGCHNNDYIGSDVERGMGYATHINSDSNCEGNFGYGEHPPSYGVDYLSGPPANEGDGIDNDRDGDIDETNEHWIINHAMYLSNPYPTNESFQTMGYMAAQSRFPDGSHLLYGTSVEPGDPEGLEADMIYPNNSDPNGYSTGQQGLEPWAEWTVLNPSGDRRLFVSCGPFDLLSDESFTATKAYIWARDESSDDIPYSLQALQQADDQVQQYFDNCFENIPCETPAASIEYSAQDNEFVFESSYEAEEYQWDFGDGSTAETDVSAIEHTYSVPGSYTVCLTVSNECSSNFVCQEISATESPSFQMMDIQRIEGVGNGRHFLEFNEASKDSVLENGKVVHPVYPGGNAPIQVFHEDGMEPEDGIYGVRFTGVSEDAHWKIFKYGENDTITSEYAIGDGIVEYIPDYGVYVYVNKLSIPEIPSEQDVAKAIGFQVEYEDPQAQWLSGVEDGDLPNAENWIRNGVYASSPYASSEPFDCDADFADQLDHFDDIQPYDSEEQYETIYQGIWAPIRYARGNKCLPFPGFPGSVPDVFESDDVDIVLTSDRTKWTRSMVISFEPEPDGIGNRYEARNTLSVDKYGRDQNNPNCNIEEATFDGQQVNEEGLSYGMGWFPGYAINLETGNRYNIVFAENPEDTENNGDDMIWNPTSQKYDEEGNHVFGGSHMIYLVEYGANFLFPYTVSFDHGQYLYNESLESNEGIEQYLIRAAAQWTSIPLLLEEAELMSMEEGLIPTDTEIKLRIEQPYDKHLPVGQDTINNRNPLYRFSPNGQLQSLSHTAEVEMDMSLIAYPNPSSDQIMIRLPEIQVKGEIRIVDSQGRRVWSRNAVSGNLITIGVDNWDAGVYLVKYTSGEQNLNTRFVVQ